MQDQNPQNFTMFNMPFIKEELEKIQVGNIEYFTPWKNASICYNIELLVEFLIRKRWLSWKTRHSKFSDIIIFLCYCHIFLDFWPRSWVLGLVLLHFCVRSRIFFDFCSRSRILFAFYARYWITFDFCARSSIFLLCIGYYLIFVLSLG